MIRLVLIIFLGSITACGLSKGVAKEGQPNGEPEKESSQATNDYDQVFYLGEVQLLDCGVVIQISSGEKKSNCAPINLDQKFHVDKLRLKLKFKVLDERGTICSEFPAIEITEVFAVR